MTSTSTTSLTGEWVPEPLPPSTDVLLRLRHLEAHVQALEVAVRDLARALDQRAGQSPEQSPEQSPDRTAADIVRETLDGLPPAPHLAR